MVVQDESIEKHFTPWPRLGWYILICKGNLADLCLKSRTGVR